MSEPTDIRRPTEPRVSPVWNDAISRAMGLPTQVEDVVNHPSHYTAYQGLEIIQLTEQMNFNRGNAVKYIARAGLKNKASEVQDLQKAAWYIAREIERLQREQA